MRLTPVFYIDATWRRCSSYRTSSVIFQSCILDSIISFLCFRCSDFARRFSLFFYDFSSSFASIDWRAGAILWSSKISRSRILLAEALLVYINHGFLVDLPGWTEVMVESRLVADDLLCRRIAGMDLRIWLKPPKSCTLEALNVLSI